MSDKCLLTDVYECSENDSTIGKCLLCGLGSLLASWAPLSASFSMAQGALLAELEVPSVSELEFSRTNHLYILPKFEAGAGIYNTSTIHNQAGFNSNRLPGNTYNILPAPDDSRIIVSTGSGIRCWSPRGDLYEPSLPSKEPACRVMDDY